MIPKPGKDPTNPLSYRSISLLNIAGKVFEKIFSTRLKNFLEINQLLPPEQFGFRSELCTINPILEFYTDTTRHVSLKEYTLVVFLDIKRAFDWVWRRADAETYKHPNKSRTKIRLFADDTAVSTSQKNPVMAGRITWTTSPPEQMPGESSRTRSNPSPSSCPTPEPTIPGPATKPPQLLLDTQAIPKL
ncbi:hypothetical protein MTP99_017250 [Tenebrio molitor]|jgi:hypothetical protein|nr:hypothetical protein MTP99_017250 [Tenebrio molitor]